MSLSCIAVTGATGFVGHHLLRSLAATPALQIRAMAHRRAPPLAIANPVTWVQGSLDNSSSLDALLDGADTLVHLAYPAGWDEQQHQSCIQMLAQATSANRLRRVIHCSTAVVVGPGAASPVDEDTPAKPSSAYERNKLQLEALWREASLAATHGFDLAILRPTAVFGPGGRNLMRLAHALWSGSGVINYLRASISGARRMNLVCIDNVTSALRFLIARPEPCEGHAFIVSDDDSPDNNYRDVERILRAAFGRPMTAMAPLPLPSGLLDASLWIRGHARSNLVYTGHRLAEAGWRRPVAFREGLQAFADWFASSRGSS